MRPHLAITAAAAGLWAARRYYRNWGATKEESRASMFGDGYVHNPVAQTTAAEWIDAPVDAVWAEMTGRLCGAPPLVGDVVGVPLVIGGWRIGTVSMSVVEVEANRAVVLRALHSSAAVDATCTWLIEPRWQDRTRLIMRLRIALRHPGDVVVAETVGPALAVITRGLLAEIRCSAELSPLELPATSA